MVFGITERPASMIRQLIRRWRTIAWSKSIACWRRSLLVSAYRKARWSQGAMLLLLLLLNHSVAFGCLVRLASYWAKVHWLERAQVNVICWQTLQGERRLTSSLRGFSQYKQILRSIAVKWRKGFPRTSASCRERSKEQMMGPVWGAIYRGSQPTNRVSAKGQRDLSIKYCKKKTGIGFALTFHREEDVRPRKFGGRGGGEREDVFLWLLVYVGVGSALAPSRCKKLQRACFGACSKITDLAPSSRFFKTDLVKDKPRVFTLAFSSQRGHVPSFLCLAELRLSLGKLPSFTYFVSFTTLTLSDKHGASLSRRRIASPVRTQTTRLNVWPHISI